MKILKIMTLSWQMIGHMLRYGDELHSLTIEEMIKGTRSRERPKTK